MRNSKIKNQQSNIQIFKYFGRRTPSARMQQLGTPAQPGTSKNRKKKKRCVSLRFPQALRTDHDTSTTDAQHHGSRWPAPTSRQKTSRTQQVYNATTSKSAKNKHSHRRLVFDLLTSVKTLYCNGLPCVAAMSRATRCEHQSNIADHSSR